MGSLPLHPAIVHVPLGLAFVLPLLALWLALRGRRSGWAIVVALQAVLLAGALVALSTGEADEDRVEAVVGHAAVEAHEHAAQTFTAVAGGTLAVMLGGLLLGAGRLRSTTLALAVLGSCVTAGLGVRAGHAGGALVHGDGAAASITGATGLDPGDDDDSDSEERG